MRGGHRVESGASSGRGGPAGCGELPGQSPPSRPRRYIPFSLTGFLLWGLSCGPAAPAACGPGLALAVPTDPPQPRVPGTRAVSGSCPGRAGFRLLGFLGGQGHIVGQTWRPLGCAGLRPLVLGGELP